MPTCCLEFVQLEAIVPLPSEEAIKVAAGPIIANNDLPSQRGHCSHHLEAELLSQEPLSYHWHRQLGQPYKGTWQPLTSFFRAEVFSPGLPS